MVHSSPSTQSSAILNAAQTMNRMAVAGEPFLFIFDFEMQRPIVCPLREAANQGIYYNFCGSSNGTPSKLDSSNASSLISIISPQEVRARYEKNFSRIKHHLSRGDIYLINLTQKVPITCSSTLEQIYFSAHAPYRLLLQDRCVVFSPEPFITISGRDISTYPMKGTIAASQNDAEQRLITDPKEAAEHVTVVDLLRNDLSVVASEVRVERYQYIERIETPTGGLLQASSKISGVLPENFRESLGSLICSLLPAGSVSGAPKLQAVKIIGDVEDEPRGYYTGVSGIYDGANLVSTVLIRFIEVLDGQCYFRSGGGITFQSDSETEFQELMNKIVVPGAVVNSHQTVREASRCAL